MRENQWLMRTNSVASTDTLHKKSRNDGGAQALGLADVENSKAAKSPTTWRPPAMSTAEAEAEDLIAHLSRGLHPADRDAFRRAAEAASASSPQCWGPGSIYRAIVPLWRDYFHPPADGQVAGWDYSQRRSSKLIGAPPLKDDRDRRCARLRLGRGLLGRGPRPAAPRAPGRALSQAPGLHRLRSAAAAHRIRHGRRQPIVVPLFPGYSLSRWCCNGAPRIKASASAASSRAGHAPAVVPDAVIDDIRP
jgi:hypothetical protein